MKKFDVVIIGAGPAGYVAAIRCAQLGMNTACIDKRVDKDGNPVLGGTCLNEGCIPSKAWLESSEHYDQLLNKFEAHGIRASKVSLDVAAMNARKDETVRTLTKGIEYLFKKNKITWIAGSASLKSGQSVEVTGNDGATEIIEAGSIIIATGSAPRDIPNIKIDGQYIVDSGGALDFTSVPPRLGIIGAGVIGLELGSVWKRLGSEVIMLEAMDAFLPMVDDQIAQTALDVFKQQGLDIHLGARVQSAQITGKKVNVTYEDASGAHSVKVDKLIVAVGRKPMTDGLKPADAGLLLDERGFIHVNEYCRTNLPNVYAIGDAVRGPALAHKGSEEGVMVAERLAGHDVRVNYETIPWVIYTAPEIAWVGKTEKQLRAAAREFKTGVFPLTASGRARAMDETAGLVKVIADAKTDRLLGVHIYGPNASELIAEAVVALEFAASAEDLQRIVHAHPSISEAVHEAALALDGKALHI